MDVYYSVHVLFKHRDPRKRDLVSLLVRVPESLTVNTSPRAHQRFAEDAARSTLRERLRIRLADVNAGLYEDPEIPPHTAKLAENGCYVWILSDSLS